MDNLTLAVYIMGMKNTEATKFEAQDLIYKSPIRWTPQSETDDMVQRDRAAEAARQWARHSGHAADVMSITRGRKNLVVRMRTY